MDSFITGDIFTRTPPVQTLKAWAPYLDCVEILLQFQHFDIVDGDDELREWRLYWVSGVALLRTVGHVLAKVDALSSPAHSAAVDGLWATLKADKQPSSIFWSFIEKERNNLLQNIHFWSKTKC